MNGNRFFKLMMCSINKCLVFNENLIISDDLFALFLLKLYKIYQMLKYFIDSKITSTSKNSH